MDKGSKISPNFIKTDEEKNFAARLIDKLNLAEKTGQIQVTDFIDPHLQALANRVMKDYAGLQCIVDGGSEQAERKRVIISAEPLEKKDAEEYVALLGCVAVCSAKEYLAAKITHRDYLGALLGTGIRREKLGDILLTEKGCIIAAAREIAGYIYQQPFVVKGIPFEMSETEPEVCATEAGEGKIVTTTVASLRLDAVAAAGFGTSRSKLTREILAGRFKVNWQEVTRLDYQLSQQDVISCRGRGRVVIESAGGESKKGRIKVTLKRLN